MNYHEDNDTELRQENTQHHLTAVQLVVVKNRGGTAGKWIGMYFRV